MFKIVPPGIISASFISQCVVSRRKQSLKLRQHSGLHINVTRIANESSNSCPAPALPSSIQFNKGICTPRVETYYTHTNRNDFLGPPSSL